MEFVPDRSFAYRFSRYEILPELQQLPEVQSGDSFLLRELAWPLIDSHLTQEQQSRHLAANGSTQPLLPRRTPSTVSLLPGPIR